MEHYNLSLQVRRFSIIKLANTGYQLEVINEELGSRAEVLL
jgi:hypothetical protein